jgi:hypothetical protein
MMAANFFLLATEFSPSQEFGVAPIFLVFEPCRVGVLDGRVFLGASTCFGNRVLVLCCVAAHDPMVV